MMTIKIKQWVSSLPEYIPGRTIEEIKRVYGLETVYKMASNENLYGPHPGIIEEVKKHLGSINYYPDSDCREIRQKISQVYKIPADMIIIGNGTDQIIEMACDSLIGPGENVVIADPTFLIYEKAALKCGGTAIKVPLSGYRHDIRKLAGAVDDKTRILFLTNPHNPTGTNINKDEFDYVKKNLRKDVLLVIDEAYYEYVPERQRINTEGMVSQSDNVLVLRTFSKIFGLAGLRIGYGIADKAVIAALNKVRLPFNINSIAQKAAVAALENRSYADEIREKIIREKEKFYSVLDNIKFFDKHTDLLEIFIHYRSEYKKDSTNLYHRHYAQGFKATEETIKQCIKKGLMKKIQPKALTNILIDLFYGMLFTTFFSAEKKPFKQKGKYLEEIILGNLLIKN